MKICINALFAKSRGILKYGYQIVKYLTHHYPEITITLLLNKHNHAFFSEFKKKCTFWIVPFRSYFVRIGYLHLSLGKLKHFDLIHSIANIGVLVSPKPQCITIHDTYEQVSPERFHWLKRFLMAKMIAISGAHSQKIIAVSNSTKNDVSRFYKHLAMKTIAIYSGCNYPIIEEKSLIHLRKKNFLFVGTIEPGKNLVTVIKAMKELVKTNNTDNLIIIGSEGWRQSFLPKMIDEYHLSPRIIFLGYVSAERLITEYKQAKALILPSTYEGFGFPVIEAMACGCPVLAANNSSLPEAGGDAALYFNTMDYSELARLMNSLDSSSHYYKGLLRRGLKQAAKFDWSKTVSSLLDVYRDISLP